MNNPTAFPSYEYQKSYGQMMAVGGMTLRDYFAARAIEGASVSAISNIRYNHDLLAADAYALADAMLVAREKS
jgi:hypothetical protein